MVIMIVQISSDNFKGKKSLEVQMENIHTRRTYSFMKGFLELSSGIKSKYQKKLS